MSRRHPRAPARWWSGSERRWARAQAPARTTTRCSARNGAKGSSTAVLKVARRATRQVVRKPVHRWSVRSCGHAALKCRRGSPPIRKCSPRRPRRRCWRRRLAARMRRVSLPRSGERATSAADLARVAGQASLRAPRDPASRLGRETGGSASAPRQLNERRMAWKPSIRSDCAAIRTVMPASTILVLENCASHHVPGTKRVAGIVDLLKAVAIGHQLVQWELALGV